MNDDEKDDLTDEQLRGFRKMLLKATEVSIYLTEKMAMSPYPPGRESFMGIMLLAWALAREVGMTPEIFGATAKGLAEVTDAVASGATEEEREKAMEMAEQLSNSIKEKKKGNGSERHSLAELLMAKGDGKVH